MINKRIAVARGQEKAELVIKNAKIINVFTETIESGDVAVVDGIIAGIGTYEGQVEHDAGGGYLLPGLIDAHVHVESSMCRISSFAEGVLSRGTTTVIADPHEIANVAGEAGLRYFVEAGRAVPLDLFFMLPSCVPATPFDHAGAVLCAEDLAPFYREPEVLGLGEMMNVPGLLAADPEVLEKIAGAKGRPIDGHAPGLMGKDLSAYLAAGIRTDHECTTLAEMQERLTGGAYVQIREGSAAKNLDVLIGGVTRGNHNRVLLCTDDRHPGDLLAEGHIDHLLRRAVGRGVPAMTAIKMATLNAATCYGLKDRGGLAPGYLADMVLVDNLTAFNVREVYKRGTALSDLRIPADEPPAALLDTVVLDAVTAEDFRLPLASDIVRVIGLIPESIVTEKVVRKVDVVDGCFADNTHLDLIKMAVFERHAGTKKRAVALVEGFGLTGGALATTISHDSHNIVVVGREDEEMALAVNRIRDLKGGVVFVRDREVVAEIPLPIAGLMSLSSMEAVAAQVEGLKASVKEAGLAKGIDPILTLAFLSLPVIPALKLTESGLFDGERFSFCPIEVIG